jgi:hypothetical protein
MIGAIGTSDKMAESHDQGRRPQGQTTGMKPLQTSPEAPGGFKSFNQSNTATGDKRPTESSAQMASKVSIVQKASNKRMVPTENKALAGKKDAQPSKATTSSKAPAETDSKTRKGQTNRPRKLDPSIDIDGHTYQQLRSDPYRQQAIKLIFASANIPNDFSRDRPMALFDCDNVIGETLAHTYARAMDKRTMLMTRVLNYPPLCNVARLEAIIKELINWDSTKPPNQNPIYIKVRERLNHVLELKKQNQIKEARKQWPRPEHVAVLKCMGTRSDGDGYLGRHVASMLKESELEHLAWPPGHKAIAKTWAKEGEIINRMDCNITKEDVQKLQARLFPSKTEATPATPAAQKDQVAHEKPQRPISKPVHHIQEDTTPPPLPTGWSWDHQTPASVSNVARPYPVPIFHPPAAPIAQNAALQLLGSPANFDPTSTADTRITPSTTTYVSILQKSPLTVESNIGQVEHIEPTSNTFQTARHDGKSHQNPILLSDSSSTGEKRQRTVEPDTAQPRKRIRRRSTKPAETEATEDKIMPVQAANKSVGVQTGLDDVLVSIQQHHINLIAVLEAHKQEVTTAVHTALESHKTEMVTAVEEMFDGFQDSLLRKVDDVMSKYEFVD